MRAALGATDATARGRARAAERPRLGEPAIGSPRPAGRWPAGTTQLVVGTRALLGEGWDAPSLNVVVDLTTVAADVSVRQMRGRALRLDPADPDKLASNWDVVCVAPDLARGTADYGRFVRRHSHLHAPCEDGSIETGVSHVHPLLSPYLPPEDAELEQLNVDGVARAVDRTGARTRWRIGEPYVGEDVPVLLVRRSQTTSAGRRETPMATGLIGELPGSTPRPRGLSAALRVRALERDYPTILPLDRVARAIVDTYVALGEIGERSAASLTLTPRAGGIVRCSMPSRQRAGERPPRVRARRGGQPGEQPPVRRQPSVVAGRRTPAHGRVACAHVQGAA